MLLDDNVKMLDYLRSQTDIAQVSEDLPLLSNLTLLENMALMLEAHEKKSVVEAESKVLELLQKLGIQSIADQRVSASSEDEVFYCKFIRAVLSPFSKIVISMPAQMISQQHSASVICDLVQKLKIEKKVTIIDLVSNQAHYSGETCVIPISK